jgi:hypothetical protein
MNEDKNDSDAFTICNFFKTSYSDISSGEKQKLIRKDGTMRRVLGLYGLIIILAMAACGQANLLSNGDFELPGTGATATDWVAWSWGNGWANTEQAAWGSGSWHITGGAAGGGGGGFYQIHPVTPGTEYILNVDSGADAWWLPTGTMAMIWLRTDMGDLLDPNTIVSQTIRNTVDPAVYGEDQFDIPHPWENYTLAGTAPVGAFFVKVEFAANNATGSVGFDNASFILTNNPYPPYSPLPSDKAVDRPVNTILSWHISDPNGVPNPDLVSHKLYMSDGSDDPNVFYVDTIVGWDAGTLRASYTPASNLNLDGRYFWRVDMVMDDASEITGPTWEFYTLPSSPAITSDPNYQLVDAGTTANFSVEVSSVSPETYQWYKAGDPNVALSDSGDISGAMTAHLLIANAEIADEGGYYCVVSNDATLPNGALEPPASQIAQLIIKRKLAHWDFESNNADSIVPDSPTSTIVGDPAFVTGVSGDGMEFDADTGAEDMLYTDLNATDYFDACNYNLTVACWIKSTSTVNWAPLVSRNGEENGWQLRQGAAGAPGDDRPVFSTRGLDVDDNDGIPGDRTVFDGQWHYLAATYDGAFKKLYIDGVISRIYTVTNGGGGVEISSGEAATGLISASASGIPVAIAGRYGDDPVQIDDQFTAGVYDEVEIYNYALDAATIAQNYATVTSTPVCPAALDYDQNGDCKVDLVDLGLLASAWLTDTSVQP